jgi:hypothetical protein
MILILAVQRSEQRAKKVRMATLPAGPNAGVVGAGRSIASDLPNERDGFVRLPSPNDPVRPCR